MEAPQSVEASPSPGRTSIAARQDGREKADGPRGPFPPAANGAIMPVIEPRSPAKAIRPQPGSPERTTPPRSRTGRDTDNEGYDDDDDAGADLEGIVARHRVPGRQALPVVRTEDERTFAPRPPTAGPSDAPRHRLEGLRRLPASALGGAIPCSSASRDDGTAAVEYSYATVRVALTASTAAHRRHGWPSDLTFIVGFRPSRTVLP